MGNLQDWQNFYVVVGTGGAAFVGFVYLAVSIHPKIIEEQADAGLYDLVQTTVFQFLGLFILALGFLFPGDAFPTKLPWDHHDSITHQAAYMMAPRLGIFLAAVFTGLSVRQGLTEYDDTTAVSRIGRRALWFPGGIAFIGFVLLCFSICWPDVLIFTPIFVFLLTLFGLGNVWNLLIGVAAMEKVNESDGGASREERFRSPQRGRQPIFSVATRQAKISDLSRIRPWHGSIQCVAKRAWKKVVEMSRYCPPKGCC